ncbi:hypothetical protein NDU88_001119 [Pleurodeles waltl]|uniref:Uncharacterized protein n=1 Tax=Pleurodeles waltl TaxID=8319 RepID=A0AAV7WLJ5_PLEWA|nr:hypothetical protein NDU88_001119 [Pleurodeles waltl]
MPQCPARARRRVCGPAPARPGATPASSSSAATPLHRGRPLQGPWAPAAPVPLAQRGDSTGVPRRSQADCPCPAAALCTTRGRGFSHGDWPPVSSPASRAGPAHQHSPEPQRGPGSAQGQPPVQYLRTGSDRPGDGMLLLDF